MAQRYQISAQEYVNTRTYAEFSEDVIAWYSEVLAPVAALAEAFGGSGDDEGDRPRSERSVHDQPRKSKGRTPHWLNIPHNANVYRLGKPGDKIDAAAEMAMKTMFRGQAGASVRTK